MYSDLHGGGRAGGGWMEGLKARGGGGREGARSGQGGGGGGRGAESGTRERWQLSTGCSL